jgi:predicted nucleic acid-binding protein
LTAFLDSSVILSALGSQSGGSALLFTASKKGKIRLLVSPYVISEVLNHVDKIGSSPQAVKRLITSGQLLIVKDASSHTTRLMQKISRDKQDSPILAAAIEAGSQYLLSLDKKHIVTTKIISTLKPVKVMTPKQFWHSMQS